MKKKAKRRWSITYRQDGKDRGWCFIEWWNVTDGIVVFRCNFEREAEWLEKVLNNLPEGHDAP